MMLKQFAALFVAFSLQSGAFAASTGSSSESVKTSKTLMLASSSKDTATVSVTSAGANSAPCISWVNPRVKPRAVLLCIHGLGLYSGSFTNFGRAMSRSSIATYAIDVRGFGSWMKNGGHEQVDFNGCLDDIRTALTSIRAANPGLPVILLGESMGGAIALRAASMYPDLIDGLISSVPSGDRFKQKKTDLKVALEFLTGPSKQHNVGTGVINQATENEKLREDWANNPLDRMDLSPKELIQFQSFMNDNHDSAKKITKTSILMVEGTRDKLVKPEGTWDLFNEIESDAKTFLALPSEHLIYEEQQDKQGIYDFRVNRLTAAWILTHVLTDQTNVNDQDAQSSLAAGPKAHPEVTGGVPTVVAFYVPWAVQCKGIQPMFQRLRAMHGNKLKLLQVNIEDPNYKNLVKDYNIGPVPTFVYLTLDGNVAKTSVGMSSIPEFAKNLETILPPTN